MAIDGGAAVASLRAPPARRQTFVKRGFQTVRPQRRAEVSFARSFDALCLEVLELVGQPIA